MFVSCNSHLHVTECENFIEQMSQNKQKKSMIDVMYDVCFVYLELKVIFFPIQSIYHT